ncbi:MAG: type I-E CRISPR-associated protein Cas5/CasD [Sulfobacillus sp.]
MIDAIVLRLDAPLMSFGGVIVDHYGAIDAFPARSLLTGLVANALGWTHHDAILLNALQDRLTYAARWDVPSQPLRDYQTVDLTQSYLAGPGWTTWGIPDGREGDKKGYHHQRDRWYQADGLLTLVLTVTDSASPSLDRIAEALRHPARPLFLGRKPCLPARPVLDPVTPRMTGPSLRTILQHVPVWDRAGRIVEPSPDYSFYAAWPDDDPGNDPAHPAQWHRIYGLRDWVAQIPSGSYGQYRGALTVMADSHPRHSSDPGGVSNVFVYD